MKQLDETFYNQAAEYLDTPDAIKVDEAYLERMWNRYKPAFSVAPIQSVTSYEAPDFYVLKDGQEIQVEYDGWLLTETVIFRNGDIWLRWYQKHGGELLEICVKRGE